MFSKVAINIQQVSVLFILTCIVSCSSSKDVTKNNLTAITDQIRQLEHNALVAEFKMDTAAIAAVMDDGFINIDEKKVQNKQQELTGIYNNIKKRMQEGHTIDSFYLDEFRVDLFDNTAVATFFTVTKGQFKGKPYENRRTRFYDVWVKRKGSWKLVSMQATFL